MTALSANSKTIVEKASGYGMLHEFPATDSTTYYQGGLVCISGSTGKVVKGSTATGLICIGVCQESVTTGTSTTETIKALSGIFGPFANSSAGDAIADDDIGKKCYIVDDATLALTDGSGTRSEAGTVYTVETAGVYVAIKFPL